MPYNPSVARFKRDMFNLNELMRRSFHDQKSAQADELMENMRARVPVKSGALKSSIRKRDISTENRASFLVMAGGPLTTKTSHGHTYDYAMGTEFGTVNERPEPFFYNTARDYFAPVNIEDRETFEQIIANNNQMRAQRANDYSNGSVTRSSMVREGHVVHKYTFR
jgi:hypothetical protein